MNGSDSSHQILILQMELQRSVGEFARSQGVDPSTVKAWECADLRVRQAWRNLTRRENLPGLEDWFRAEQAAEQSSHWMPEAIRQCMARGLEK